MQAWRDDAHAPATLFFTAFESAPPKALDPLLRVSCFGLLPGVHRILFEDGKVQLTLCIGEAPAIGREIDIAADSLLIDHLDLWGGKHIARLCKRGTAVSWHHANPDALAELQQALAEKNIPLFLLTDDPIIAVPKFIELYQASLLITDFSPLRIGRYWRGQIANRVEISMEEVDAHNIVPCWIASPKMEFAAYTIRPKLKKLLPDYNELFPDLEKHDFKFKQSPEIIDADSLLSKLKIDHGVTPVDWLEPGERAAKKKLNSFITNKLINYDQQRNDPNLSAQSDLSPYFHFGQLAPARAVLEVQSAVETDIAEPYLEELIIRRELSDNFCYYQPNYDSVNGFPAWSLKNLAEHKDDEREYIYSLSQFENSQTHDELWNAAQQEMVLTGKMHGYMRMYWAKKILEWTPDSETAMKFAIYLNDKYELDGRDPNGYVGIAWSIGGVHDRAWFSRKIFGKIRYMSYGGAKGKFNIKAYIAKYDNL